ncbi:MAG TPA: hypothetical protein VEK84_10345, partial [Terriglobales bacterium]|nr:hypothetical protein [Terriglobales bacterium]
MAEKKRPSLRKNPRAGAGFARAVSVPVGFCVPFAGGGSGALNAGAVSGRDSTGNARTSSMGGGGGPLAWNTKGASTCTRSSGVVRFVAISAAGATLGGVFSRGTVAALGAGPALAGIGLAGGASLGAGRLFTARNRGWR